MKKLTLKKPRMALMIAALVAALLLMFALRTCARDYASGQEGKSEGDTIDVAIEYGPMSLYMYADTLGGFNHDFLRLIASREHIALKFHPVTSLEESLKRLDEGEYDIVAAQVPATSDFKRLYLFSSPIFIDKQVLVQKKDSLGGVTVESQLDLAHRTICVAEKSPAVTRIANLAREIGDTIYVKELDFSQEQLFLLVAAGEEEFAVVNAMTADALAPSYPDINVSTAISFNQFHSWVLRKGNTSLLAKLDEWIESAKATDEYKRLYGRYFEK